MPPAELGDPARLDVETDLGSNPDGFLAAPPLATSQWQFIGPSKLPLSGRVNGVAYAPSNASIRYLASATGGVWKTTNGGTTWVPKSDMLSTLETTSVAVHPTDPDTVYVGTGDFDGQRPRYSLGIIKSTDGGNTWTQLDLPSSDLYATSNGIRAIVIDPENPQIVTATSGNGVNGLGYIWRTTDGGTSWSAFSPGVWSDLEIGARETATGIRYYYAVRWDESGVWRSADRGASWTKLAPSPLNYTLNPPITRAPVEVAASRVNPRNVYVVADLSDGGVHLYGSTDAGQTFTEIPIGIQTSTRSITCPYSARRVTTYTQCGYDLALGSGGTSATGDLVYLGLQLGFGAYRPNTGAWTTIDSGHVDHHNVAINPNGLGVTIANDGGVYANSFNTSTDNWAPLASSLNSTLGLTQFYHQSTHPGDLTRAFGGTQDNGTIASLGDLTAWSQISGGDGGYARYDPSLGSRMYYTNNAPSIIRSDKSGTSPIDITPRWGGEKISAVGNIFFDSNSPRWLYTGTNYLWRYDALADTWTGRVGGNEIVRRDGPLAMSNATTTSVSVAKSNPNYVYTAANDGSVWMVDNARSSSVGPFTDISVTLPDRDMRPITVVDVNPQNAFDILIGGDRAGDTGEGGVWRCSD
ncbi:MAG TPA: hypothetical protein VJT73_16880, partial [Polyangiaceae bacterium]|nr:hypothetical protein [Polyangiaceae bacterium]